MRFLLCAIVACAVAGAAWGEEHVLKLGTLAPEGTSWMRAGHEWADALAARSGGRLRVRLFAGGVMGDEREMVHRVRTGQLAGAAITTVGLSVIQSDLLVLEQPMFFRGYAELDHVRARLDDELRRRFVERGFVLLAWADVGEVHIFSKAPLRTRADLDRARVWSWVDDPVSRSLIQELHVRGVPLGAPDVLAAFERGLVDVCYGSPLAVLAFQWHSHVRYMTSRSVSLGVGALLLAKRDFDALPPDLQQILVEESKRLEARLVPLVREDDARALAALKRGGLQVVAVPAPLVEEFQAASERTRDHLDGSEYGHELRLRVERVLSAFRTRAPRDE